MNLDTNLNIRLPQQPLKELFLLLAYLHLQGQTCATMHTISTKLRSPFPTVPPHSALGRGATGVVYPVNDVIVVKTIYLFDNPLPDHKWNKTAEKASSRSAEYSTSS